MIPDIAWFSSILIATMEDLRYRELSLTSIVALLTNIVLSIYIHNLYKRDMILALLVFVIISLSLSLAGYGIGDSIALLSTLVTYPTYSIKILLYYLWGASLILLSIQIRNRMKKTKSERGVPAIPILTLVTIFVRVNEWIA
ncbi:MAG: hypothetical protein DRN81_02530 [Thermoproteota archaeon]|nr:MAG: hypothetical protein DRN81_02530 [Candidatus Korarchaeota archaeon]